LRQLVQSIIFYQQMKWRHLAIFAPFKVIAFNKVFTFAIVCEPNIVLITKKPYHAD
jgi:hypothetical protein